LNQPLAGIVTNVAAGQRFDAGPVILPELRELLNDISPEERRAGEGGSRHPEHRKKRRNDPVGRMSPACNMKQSCLGSLSDKNCLTELYAHDGAHFFPREKL
jgi:hypothetical protein